MTKTNEGISNITEGLASEFKALDKGVESETVRIMEGAYIKARYSNHMGVNLRVMFSMGTVKDHGDSCQSFEIRDCDYWHVSMETVKKTLMNRWHLWRDEELDINLGFVLIMIFQDHLREGLEQN